MSKIYKIVAVLCFVGVLICLSIEPIKTSMVASYRPKVNKQVVKANTRPKQEQRANYNFNQVKPVTTRRIINAKRYANKIQPVGQILSPSGNVHLTIGNGVSNNTLMLSAGTMRPDEVMGKGNYALAGHHMINRQALFTPFYYHLFKGNQVYLTDMSKVYQYTISKRQTISPYDTNVINNTKSPIITLITCNDTGSKRLLLQGRLSKVSNLNQAPISVKRLLNQPTNNYNVLAGY